MSTASSLRHDNRDVVYKLVSPLYEHMARWVPAGVSPNQLTLAGLACMAAAAGVLIAWQSPWACLAAAGLVWGFEVFDSLDGKHARNTGQSSRFGAYLDTSVDGIAAGVLYTGLVAHFALYSPLFLFAIALRMAKACLVYAASAETGARLNPEFGTSGENYLLVALLSASAFFPHAAIDLAALAGQGSWLAQFLAEQKLATMGFMQAGLLFGVVFLPISGVLDMLAIRRELEAPRAEAA